jgi:hypothetical protein
MGIAFEHETERLRTETGEPAHFICTPKLFTLNPASKKDGFIAFNTTVMSVKFHTSFGYGEN